jgi:voltage-gated potassium channel
MTAIGTGTTPDSARTGTPSRRASPLGRLLRALGAIVRVGIVLVLLVAGYLWAPWGRRVDTSVAFQLTVWLVVLALVLLWEVRGILRSLHPWRRAAESAALSVACLVLPFASTYVLMAEATPGSFTEPLSRLDGVYFTVTVFSTVGFGDITPVSESARAVVTVQILADLVLLGVIARLVFWAAQTRHRGLRAARQGAGSDNAGGSAIVDGRPAPGTGGHDDDQQ